MRVYHFSECPYPEVWKHAKSQSIRVTLPNRYFDPKVGADLINQRLDEWLLADELDLNIMINEHRSASTCMTASCIPPLAIMARQTKKARLLVLGATIGMRHDPLLLASELAYVDVVSRGRLEMGLVKGYPAEVAPSNANPAQVSRRFWEGHDLILKAMASRDGPFNWDGEFFQYRQANLFVRPYQEPCPPVWVTAFSPASAREIASRGHTVSSGFGARSTQAIYAAYRERFKEVHGRMPRKDRFGYLCLVGVGHTEAQGHARLKEIQRVIWSSEATLEQFSNPPGYNPISANVQVLKHYPNKLSSWEKSGAARSGKRINPVTATAAELADGGVGFGGTPDQVFEQIRDFYHFVGGFGHLIAMMHGGELSHEDTIDGMKLFSREVLPRLKDLVADDEKQFAAAS